MRMTCASEFNMFICWEVDHSKSFSRLVLRIKPNFVRPEKVSSFHSWWLVLRVQTDLWFRPLLEPSQ